MTGQEEVDRQEGPLEQDSFLQELEETVPSWTRSSRKLQQQREGLQRAVEQAARGMMAWPELGVVLAWQPTESPLVAGVASSLSHPQTLWQQVQGPQIFSGELDNLRDTSILPSQCCPQASGLLLPGKPTSGCARAFLESGAFPKVH